MKQSLEKFITQIKINTTLILNSRKFFGIIFFLFAINSLTGFVSYVISAKNNEITALAYIYDFIATWEILLISNVFAVIVPLFLTNIALSDQIRLKRIFNLATRPTKRETILTAIFTSIILIGLTLGLALGIFTYLALETGIIASGAKINIPTGIITQITVLMLTSTIFYSSFMMTITLTMNDYGLKSIIVFFFLTMLYDLLFTALGGGYLTITMNYYKISLLYNLAGNQLLANRIHTQLPITPANTIHTITILTTTSLIAYTIALIKFKKHNIT